MDNSKKLSRNKKVWIGIALVLGFLINLRVHNNTMNFILRVMKSAISMWIGVVAIFLVAKIISLINLSRES